MRSRSKPTEVIVAGGGSYFTRPKHEATTRNFP